MSEKSTLTDLELTIHRKVKIDPVLGTFGDEIIFMPGDIISDGKDAMICRSFSKTEQNNICNKCILHNNSFLGMKCYDVCCHLESNIDDYDVYFERIDL